MPVTGTVNNGDFNLRKKCERRPCDDRPGAVRQASTGADDEMRRWKTQKETLFILQIVESIGGKLSYAELCCASNRTSPSASPLLAPFLFGGQEQQLIVEKYEDTRDAKPNRAKFYHQKNNHDGSVSHKDQ